MKTRELYIFTLLFILSSLYSANVVSTSLIHQPLLPKKEQILALFSDVDRQDATTTCASQPANASLSISTEPHLQKLDEYQNVCGSYVSSEMMLFTDMPKDDDDARRRATAMAGTLKSFKEAGVKPLVMVEPVSEWGLIDFKEFGDGFYDQWLATYFSTLKSNGISDQDMGTWAPFPEANLPYWNNQSATPNDYAIVVNKYLRAMKKQFPQAQGTVLLNSATYETTDFEWQNGEYTSLRDYVKGLDKSLVNSFGLQGFPWMPSANQAGPGIFDASEYLNYRLASEAADILGTKKIWFNTGSFSRKYTLDTERQVELSPAKRRDILNGITEEALKLKTRGYEVSINLFAEDKSEVTEATDWSYWSTSTVSTSEHRTVFVNFAQRLDQEKIPLSLFDVKK